MNFYNLSTDFIFNNNKFIATVIAPIEFLNIVITISLISILFQFKNDIKSNIKNILIIGTIYFINRIVFSEYLSYIIFAVEALIILKVFFKRDLVKIIKCMFLTFISVMMIQLIFVEILKFSNNYLKIADELIARFLTGFVLLSILLIIKRMDISIEKLKNISRREIIKILGIAIVALLAIYVQAIEYDTRSFLKSLEFCVLNTVTIILFFYVMISNISKTREIRSASVYIDNLEGYNRNLTEMNDSIRGVKHDLNNIVQAINGYIMVNDFISLKKYFSRLLSECNYIQSIETLNPEVITNPAIYSLLLNKYNVATEKGIKLSIEIMFDLSEISDYSYDISRILGILLDNAIEASLETEEKKIDVKFSSKNNIRYIVIENSYNSEKDIDTCKIFEKNFTTKKENGNKGIGLWNVQKILKKNEMLELYTSKTSKYFEQSLRIYKNLI